MLAVENQWHVSLSEIKVRQVSTTHILIGIVNEFE